MQKHLLVESRVKNLVVKESTIMMSLCNVFMVTRTLKGGSSVAAGDEPGFFLAQADDRRWLQERGCGEKRILSPESCSIVREAWLQQPRVLLWKWGGKARERGREESIVVADAMAAAIVKKMMILVTAQALKHYSILQLQLRYYHLYPLFKKK